MSSHLSDEDWAPYLEIVSRDDPDGVTLALHGEVDMASAPLLDRELHDAERRLPRRIVLDLAALDFLDSTGIHLLAGALRRAEAHPHQLVVTHVPSYAERLFALTGLDERLAVV